ncbi:MAG: ABC transporter substrate-binding protein [Gallionella sp.]
MIDLLKIKKWWLLLVFLVILIFLYSKRDTNLPIIKIGVLHSLTGVMAVSEAPLVDALRLAVEETNQSGGINGAKIEMIVSDCRSDANYCAQRAKKLITQDRVQALFGCWTSTCRKAVKSVVEQYHNLLFYPVQYEGFEQSPNIVYTGAVPNQQLIPMVSWAIRHKGPRAYLIGSDYVFPRTANAIVKRILRAKEGHLLAERYVPLDAQNLDEVVREIVKLQPDFILNTLNGDSNRYFFEALKKAGITASKTPVFSTSIGEVELAAIGPELITGHYAVWNYFQSLDSNENRAFIARFRHRFGSQRVLDDPMESSYVGLKLWVKARRYANTDDFSTFNIVLMQQTMAAPEGIVALDAETRHLWKPVRIGRVRADGQFDIVWQSGRSIGPAPYPFLLSSDALHQIEAIAQ